MIFHEGAKNHLTIVLIQQDFSQKLFLENHVGFQVVVSLRKS